ncbi:alpha/beta fold hydrolase [Micromonospora sonneratiae]|uniref:Thioesterase II family protein n=1 Tax=Micromonospora sonneratiae TaxID=1184706 RepID=A0ABW3YNE6_9ACTN
MNPVASIAGMHRLTPGRPGIRLYCFPFAGGSAAAYRPWAALLPEVDLVSFQLPGRAERLGEDPVTDLRSMVPGLATTIAADLDGRPYALFGHSMGTILAYEVAAELARLDVAAPRLLAVSGRRAPHVVDPEFVPYHPMPDDAFLARIEALGGIPPQLAEHRDLIELMLPTLRADFTAVETYRANVGERLACPIAVFGGVDDPDSPPATLLPWAELTTAPTTVHTYDGGHFFLLDHAVEVTSAIAAALGRTTAG